MDAAVTEAAKSNTPSDSTTESSENRATAADYYPPPESQGGWRKLEKPDDIRRLGGMDPDKLTDLKEWLLKSDDRNFAAVVIRNGYVVLEVERGNSAKTDSRRSGLGLQGGMRHGAGHCVGGKSKRQAAKENEL